MKKLMIVCLSVAVLCLPSCKNFNKKAETEKKEAVVFEGKKQIAEELVKADFNNILESVAKLKPAPFASATKDGRITLSNKEKKIKPNYLLAPEKASNLVTFSQKYRAVAMYAVDLVIANMYDMDSQEYKDVIAKLLIDLGDDAYTNFASMPWLDWEYASQTLQDLAKDEYEAGRQTFFWESVASSFVEQIYVISKNTKKFMPMFTDKTAADFTFNFICLFESIKTVIEMSPEMNNLYEVIKPLEVINAISVKQFEEQILSISKEIETSREALLN